MPARELWRDVSLGALGVAIALLLVAVAVEAPTSPTSPVAAAALALLVPVVLGCAAYVAWLTTPACIFTAAVVLSPVAGNWEAVGIPGVLAPDRLLIVTGIAVVALKILLGRQDFRVRLHPVHVVLALAVLYGVVSAALVGTLFHKESLLKLVEAFGITPFLVFVLAPVVFRTAEDRNILLVGLVALGTYLGVTVIFEVYGPHQLVFPAYIDDPAYGIHVDRGRGPFAEAVTNGFGLYSCAIASCVAVALWRRRGARVYAGGVAALCLMASIFTFERSVWVGTVVASLAGLAATPRLRKFLPLALGAGVISVVLALALVPGLSAKVDSRARDEGPVWDRANLAQAAVAMVRDRPLTGFGWAEFPSRSPAYFELDRNRPLTAVGLGVHNFFLTYAAELGLPGVTLWVLALALGVGGALATRGPPDLEPWRRALVPIGVFFFVAANFVPPNVFPNLMIWLWAGIVWVGRSEPAPAAQRT
jgi:O-antigen ligase